MAFGHAAGMAFGHAAGMAFGHAAVVITAHQGGWDEALFVAGPIAVFAVMLWIAKRRAEAEQRDEEE